ncbi:MAG: DUF86 domain-containing protein [Oscillospiraceae bacterium]|nr:DUF86 domain-containing protein [Oscillospiraceae bacterium]
MQIIEKIMVHAGKIVDFCDGEDKNSFLSNIMLHEACVFNMIQMGELIGKLSDEFLIKNSELPWREIRGLRNRIVHAYGDINLNAIWDTIKIDLPDLTIKLKTITTNN